MNSEADEYINATRMLSNINITLNIRCEYNSIEILAQNTA